MKLYETLEQQLKQEPNFVTDDGELKKWVVINKARNFDEELIGLLLDNQELKEKFFVEVKGTMVFNQNLFIQFLEQKNYLNDSYTQFKNKVGLTIDGKYLKQRNEVSLVWPFKDCILEGGQSKEELRREEIFFNETLAQDEITQLLEPKVLTNAKTYDKDGEHSFEKLNRDAELNKKRSLPEDTITDNLLIKGNNLLALHSLKKEFAGKVKLIYIDPPFNTGNDAFGYNDYFNHSTWLTFMRNRLIVAKELLMENGIIAIHCDDNEQAYLKNLSDEIFSRNNFENTIIVKSSTPSGRKTTHRDKKILKQKDYIHIYSKNGIKKINPQYTKRDNWDTHFSRILDKDTNEIKNLVDVLISKELLPKNSSISDIDIDNEKIKEFYLNNKSYIFQTQPSISEQGKDISLKNKDKIVKYSENPDEYALNGRRLVFLEDSIYKLDTGIEDLAILLCDFWSDIDFQNTQNEGGISFPSGKKPESLLRRLIYLFSNQKDIVLDFFSGSGTTLCSSLKLNRQFIGVEQLEYYENDSKNRLSKTINGDQSGISKSVNWKGGGSFTFLELKKYNQNFIEQIEKAKDTKALLNIWEQMKEKSFLNYNVDIKKQEEHIEEFKQLPLEQQKQHLLELLDKNQLYVNLSSLEDEDFACTDAEKKVTKDFYQIKE